MEAAVLTRYCVAMSEENIDVVLRAYAALSRGDTDTLRGLAVPELVVDFSRRLIDPVVMRDRDEALAWLSRTRDTWEDWPTWEPLELLDGRQGGRLDQHERSWEGERNRG
jgi:hypothetical protein